MTTDTKNTNIKNEIPFDKTLSVNTKIQSNDSFLLKQQFQKNFLIISKLFINDTLTSLSFWIMGIGFTFLMVFLTVLAAGSLTSTTDTTFNMDVTAALINFSIVMPTGIILLFILPTFLTKARESNLLKRLSNVGITKIQILISVVLTAFALTVLVDVLSLTLIPLISEVLTFFIYDNNNVFNIINYSDIQWAFFIPLFFIGILGLSSFGLIIGMKFKTSKSAYLVGIFIIFWSIFCADFTQYFLMVNTQYYSTINLKIDGSIPTGQDLINLVNSGSYPLLSNIIDVDSIDPDSKIFIPVGGEWKYPAEATRTTLSALSFLYLLTPFSIFSTGLQVMSGSSYLHVKLAEGQSAAISAIHGYAYFAWTLSMTISISLIIYTLLRNKGIVNFESGR